MAVTAGHCTRCETPIWRGLVRPGEQVWTPMWPDPSSVYAILETAEGLAVGLGYCAGCAPAVGDEGPVDAQANGRPIGPSRVVGLQPARDRYQFWYSSRYGDWLQAWTRELAGAARTPDTAYDALRAQWRADSGAEVTHG